MHKWIKTLLTHSTVTVVHEHDWAGWRTSNDLNLHSGGARFEFRSGHRLSRQVYRLSRQMPEHYLNLATTASFQILWNSLFVIHPIGCTFFNIKLFYYHDHPHHCCCFTTHSPHPCIFALVVTQHALKDNNKTFPDRWHSNHQFWLYWWYYQYRNE